MRDVNDADTVLRRVALARRRLGDALDQQRTSNIAVEFAREELFDAESEWGVLTERRINTILDPP